MVFILFCLLCSHVSSKKCLLTCLLLSVERSIQQLSESIIQLQVLWETNANSLGENAFQIGREGHHGLYFRAG